MSTTIDGVTRCRANVRHVATKCRRDTWVRLRGDSLRRVGRLAFRVIVLLDVGWLACFVPVAVAQDVPPPIAVFAERPSGVSSGTIQVSGSCGLDTVNGYFAGRAAVDHLGAASFGGWVGDTATREVPATFLLVLKGAQVFQVRARTGGARPDVAAALGIPAFAQSGFDVTAYLTGIPVGDYQVLIYYRIGVKEVSCLTHDEISVQ